MRSPISIQIQHFEEGPPRILVLDAPNGHNIYVGPLVNNSAVEHGALITLLGVDSSGSIPDQGWRLVDPNLPAEAARNALYIIWLTHDHDGPLGTGDLQVGFNAVLLGHHYANPMHTRDTNLGPVEGRWITVYSSEELVLLFKGCSGLVPADHAGATSR